MSTPVAKSIVRHPLEPQLTIYEVARVRERLLQLIETGVPLQLDASAIQQCDAAGVQLLCSARAMVQERHGAFEVVEPSEALCEAADALGLELASLRLLPGSQPH